MDQQGLSVPGIRPTDQPSLLRGNVTIQETHRKQKSCLWHDDTAGCYSVWQWVGFYWHSETKSKEHLKRYHILLLQYEQKTSTPVGWSLRANHQEITVQFLYYSLESGMQQSTNKHTDKKPLLKQNSTLKMLHFTRQTVQFSFFVWAKISSKSFPPAALASYSLQEGCASGFHSSHDAGTPCPLGWYWSIPKSSVPSLLHADPSLPSPALYKILLLSTHTFHLSYIYF